MYTKHALYTYTYVKKYMIVLMYVCTYECVLHVCFHDRMYDCMYVESNGVIWLHVCMYACMCVKTVTKSVHKQTKKGIQYPPFFISIYKFQLFTNAMLIVVSFTHNI